MVEAFLESCRICFSIMLLWSLPFIKSALLFKWRSLGACLGRQVHKVINYKENRAISKKYCIVEYICKFEDVIQEALVIFRNHIAQRSKFRLIHSCQYKFLCRLILSLHMYPVDLILFNSSSFYITNNRVHTVFVQATRPLTTPVEGKLAFRELITPFTRDKEKVYKIMMFLSLSCRSQPNMTNSTSVMDLMWQVPVVNVCIGV